MKILNEKQTAIVAGGLGCYCTVGGEPNMAELVGSIHECAGICCGGDGGMLPKGFIIFEAQGEENLYNHHFGSVDEQTPYQQHTCPNNNSAKNLFNSVSSFMD